MRGETGEVGDVRPLSRERLYRGARKRQKNGSQSCIMLKKGGSANNPSVEKKGESWEGERGVRCKNRTFQGGGQRLKLFASKAGGGSFSPFKEGEA